jgi:hypothetical protein
VPRRPAAGELTHRIVLGTGQQTVARVLAAAMCSFAVAAAG